MGIVVLLPFYVWCMFLQLKECFYVDILVCVVIPNLIAGYVMFKYIPKIWEKFGLC